MKEHKQPSIMKNLFKSALLITVGTIAFSSCMNKDADNYDYEAEYKKELARIDSTLEAQKPILEEYALANFDNPQLDDSTGIWFEILEPATPSTTPYQYSLTQSGSWVTPIAKVVYEGYLMNRKNDPFDKTSQPIEMSIIESSQYQAGLIQAWPIAFRPKTIIFGGKTYYTGLIEGGLQKGHKIRFIAPSPYCYDNRSNDKIPANSPLIFEIKVEDIK